MLKTLTYCRSMIRMAASGPVLVEDLSLAYGDPNTSNMLIHGDNLPALRALVNLGYTGTIDCVQMDPPYNSGHNFGDYSDNRTPDTWYDQIRSRVTLIHKLLRPTGFLVCHIDDTHAHDMRQISDEVFGRNNYWGTFHIRTQHDDPSMPFKDPAFPRFMEQMQVYRRGPDAVPFPRPDGRPVPDYVDGATLSRRSGEGGVTFRGGKKPESLIQFGFDHFAPRGGIVLDPYLGSGTGAAVATKMGLRWIGMNRHHMDTHCLPRLRAVVDGTDATGITAATGWRGGSGFRYYDAVEPST